MDTDTGMDTDTETDTHLVVVSDWRERVGDGCTAVDNDIGQVAPGLAVPQLHHACQARMHTRTRAHGVQQAESWVCVGVLWLCLVVWLCGCVLQLCLVCVWFVLRRRCLTCNVAVVGGGEVCKLRVHKQQVLVLCIWLFDWLCRQLLHKIQIAHTNAHTRAREWQKRQKGGVQCDRERCYTIQHTHTHTCTRTRTRIHAHAHAHAYTHTRPVPDLDFDAEILPGV